MWMDRTWGWLLVIGIIFYVRGYKWKINGLVFFDTHLYVYLLKKCLPDSNFLPVKYVQSWYAKYQLVWKWQDQMTE